MSPEYIYENIKNDDLILVCNSLYVDEVKSKLQENTKKVENCFVLTESIFYFLL